MHNRLNILLLVILSLVMVLDACSKRPRSTADVPRSLSAAYTITVAPFTQPINASQLIMGRIPKDQGRIPEDMLTALDMRLRHVLTTQTSRQYKFVGQRTLPANTTTFHSSEQPQALALWLAYGKKQGAQLLLVPQVLDWHEREGSKAGVTQSAHVRVEFFLLRVDTDSIMGRSIFEEKQAGLTENLLNVGSFLKRKGQWVTAGELTEESMNKAIKDLGL